MAYLTARSLVGAASLLGVMAAGPAMAGPLATIVIDESYVGLPSDPGFQAVDLTNAPLGSGGPFTTGGETVSFDGIASGQGVVIGSMSNQYAAPVTDALGDTYAGKYFSTGATSNTNPPGYIDISFSAPGGEKALALLWGSVDLSNEITFLMNGVVIGSVLGSQINAQANGNQGFGGSFYVLLNLNESFNEIQLSSGVTSFEAAEFEADPNNFYVPEPASVALLGAGLIGLAMMRRRASTP